MGTTAPNVYEFTDYHDFLQAYYLYSKATKKAFSFRYFAQHAGVSASLLVAVIQRERRISKTIAEKYATAIKLTTRETEYLLALVDFEHARGHSKKNEALSKIVQLRGQSRLRFIDTEQYEYFSHWYHATVRELISLPGFKEDPQWISEALHPRITAAQARRSLELLQRLSLVKRDKDDNLILSSKAISSEYELHSIALRNFSHEMISLAKESLETVPVELREISGLTMGISGQCVDRIKQRIRMFKEELITMIIDDNAESDTVYQLNFQFFPLVRCGIDLDKNAGNLV